ncbi:VOC family protein [Chitinibacter sp. GC72]|uniref:VOC family protein n=1 Tax=Chitinibacter sp. GC72 TaxID=1526917 RepID=UPI0012FCBBF3|nr:VOC family protein [Chitinibacter sp. GC72]
MKSLQLCTFTPAQDYALSLDFYQALGFELVFRSDELARLQHGDCAFFLQNYYVADWASNSMQHLLVEHIAPWWERAQALAAQYGVRLVPPQDQPWGQRDFVLIDPSGVLWRIAENLRGDSWPAH